MCRLYRFQTVSPEPCLLLDWAKFHSYRNLLASWMSKIRKDRARKFPVRRWCFKVKSSRNLATYTDVLVARAIMLVASANVLVAVLSPGRLLSSTVNPGSICRLPQKFRTSTSPSGKSRSSAAWSAPRRGWVPRTPASPRNWNSGWGATGRPSPQEKRTADLRRKWDQHGCSLSPRYTTSLWSHVAALVKYSNIG